MRKKDRLAAVSQRPSETFVTLPWISEWRLRRCGSRPAQPVAGRASGRDWSATRRLWRPCALQRQFGLDGAIFSGHDVPTRLRPPSDTVDLLVEQVGHRCGLGRPHKLLLRLGQITRETSDTARLL